MLNDELDFDIKFDDEPQVNVDVRNVDPENGSQDIKYGATTSKNETPGPSDTDPQLILGADMVLTSEDANPESEKPQAKPSKPLTVNSALGVFSISYWQAYFEVNQFEIKDRLIASMNPVAPVFSETIGEKPDLYGPFWIGSFLIFLLTVTGNFTELITFHA